MEDETKKVEYIFEGDVSSLEKATSDAIGWLSKYEDTIKDLTKAGKLDVSKTVFGAFNRAINGITSQVNSLVKSLNKASEESQIVLAPDTTKIQAAGRDLQDILDMLQGASNVSSKDLKFITEYLKDTQKSLTAIADRAAIVTASFKDISKLQLPKVESTPQKDLEDITDVAHTASEAIQRSTQDISSAYKDMIRNAPFINYAWEVEQSYNQISKSARESAEVLTSLKDVQFEDKLEKIRAKSAETAETIRNAFGRLSDIFSPLSAGISKASANFTSFKAKISETLDHIKWMAEAAGSGFRQFKGDTEAAGDASDKTAKDLKKESEALSQLNPKLAAAIKVFKTLKNVLGTISSACKKAKSGFDTIKRSIDSLHSKTNSASTDIKKFVSLLGGIGIGKGIGTAAKATIAYIENLNLFKVAMGETVDEASRFISRMAEIYGMDPSNLYRYSGYFYQLTDAIGTTSKASEIMSLSLTKAANDISSLFNQKVEDVVNNLASGMQGMSRAVRKYGMDIRATTLQQTALNYGFTENVTTTSEANRMALRYLTMMQQVKNATKQVTETVDGATQVMGDFARNIETPANQLRILKEQASQLARAFGNFLIPVLQKTLYVVNGILMAFKELLIFFAQLSGINISSFGEDISKSASGATDAVSGIGDAADKTAKKLRNLVAPFDEITILTEPRDEDTSLSAIGADALDPALLAALENMSLGLDEIRMKALDIRDKILELLGLEWDKDNNLVVTVNGFIDDLIHLWDDADYVGFGKRVAEFINQGIQWGIENTNPELYADILNDKVQTLAEILNGLVQGLNWTGLGTIIGNGITLSLGMINTFLETFNFKALGEALGSGLMGIVDAVNWNLLGTTIGNYFKSKIEFGLGFVESVEWKSIGSKIATGLNSVIATVPWEDLGTLIVERIEALFGLLKGFVDNFDFIALGNSFGAGIMSMIDNVNWTECGAILGKLFNGVIDTIHEYLKTYEWGSIGATLATFINGLIREINWHKFGATVSDVLRALLRDITTFIGNLDWFSIGKAIAEFITAIDWLGLLTDVVVAVITILGAVVRGLLGLIVGIFTGIGKDIADGFQGGILEGLKNIGNWLKEHLVDPVVRAVKGFFGIASPSKVFAEIGDFLIQGLLEGLLNAIKNIGNWFKTKLVDPVMNAVKNGFGINGNGSTIFKNLGTNIVTGLMSGLQTVTSKLSSWGSSLRSNISGIISGVGSTVSGFVSSIQGTLSNVVTSVTSKAQSIANSVNSALSSSRSIGATVSTSSYTSRYPRMATGGVVRGPTHVLIGEGQYPEAVVPLGNSPELQEMINKIADAVSATPRGGSNAQTPIEVHVYLDGTEITTTQNRANRMYGRTQQTI